MVEDLKCYVGMHRFRIHNEEAMTDPRGNVVGKAVIGVCEHCGKVRVTVVRTVQD